MTDLEIVQIDAAKNHSDVPVEAVYKAFDYASTDPTISIYRCDKSILLIDPTGDFHFINAATFDEFVANVKTLFELAKLDGFKDVHTTFTNPRIIDVANTAKVDYTVTKQDDTYFMKVRL
jgi:hypothetical protein